MKIYELPGEIQNRIFKLQIEAENKPDASLELLDKATEGNFDWHKSGEGVHFWKRIHSGYYKHFYEKYPNSEINRQLAAENIATKIIRNCPVALSENCQNDLICTIVMVLMENIL